MATKKEYILTFNMVQCGNLSRIKGYTNEAETGRIVIYKRPRRLTAYKYLKKKGTVVPAQAMKPYRDIKGKAPLILQLGARWMCGQLHVPAVLHPGNSLESVKKLGGSESGSRICDKSLGPTGTQTRDRPVP